MSKLVSATIVALRNSNQWDQWYDCIQSQAKAARVWKYIDPEVEEKDLPELTEPTRPTPRSVQHTSDISTTASTLEEDISISEHSSITFSTLKPEQREELRYLLDVYKEEHEVWVKADQKLQDILGLMKGSIDETIFYITKDRSVHQTLVELQKQFNKSKAVREQDLIKRWEDLKGGKKITDMETWLRKWETTFDEMKMLGIQDVQDKRPHSTFLQVVYTIEPTFTTLWELKMVDGSMIPPFRDLIQQFREVRKNTVYRHRVSSA